MPLSFPVLERTTDDRWQARCRACGWLSRPQAVKAAADYSRKLHGPEKECAGGVGAGG